MIRRYLCIACRSNDLELAEDLASPGSERMRTYSCFHCQELFFFMADAEPRPHALDLFALYPESSERRRRGS